MCGKPGTEARVYPARTLKGVVFVWVGDDDPVPIEEDVPEEFFHDDALVQYNFSRRDEAVMLHQRYDTPEKLSATDAEVIQWRRLVVTTHCGGRDAPFEYKNPGGLAPDDIPLARLSGRYLR